MSSSPLLILDPEVPLPGWFQLSAYYKRACRENPGSEQDWISRLQAIYLYATESREIQFIINISKYILSIYFWVLSSDYYQPTDDYNTAKSQLQGFMIYSLVIFLPYCLILSTQLVIFLGRAMDITDNDLLFSFHIDASSQTPQTTQTQQTLQTGSLGDIETSTVSSVPIGENHNDLHPSNEVCVDYASL